MKNKKLKISVIAATLALVFMMAAMTVYAYFTTKVYVYTDEGKQEFQTGMQLQLLFNKLEDGLKGNEIYLPNYTRVDDGNGGKTGMVKWYLDGVNVGLYSSKMADYVDHTVPVLESGITSVNIKCSPWADRDMTVNFDNIRIENTEKAYEAYVTKPY